jgi:site-specific recombinase XerD
MSLQEAFNLYIKEKEILENKAPRTVESYKKVFARYQKLVGQEVTEASVKDFIIKLREDGLAPTTCNIYIRSFNAFLSRLLF